MGGVSTSTPQRIADPLDRAIGPVAGSPLVGAPWDPTLPVLAGLIAEMERLAATLLYVTPVKAVFHCRSATAGNRWTSQSFSGATLLAEQMTDEDIFLAVLAGATCTYPMPPVTTTLPNVMDDWTSTSSAPPHEVVFNVRARWGLPTMRLSISAPLTPLD